MLLYEFSIIYIMFYIYRDCNYKQKENIMKFEIIPKQDIIPVFDSKGIKIKYIRYDPLFDNEEYEEEDILSLSL